MMLTQNLFNLPLLITIWLIELYLFCAVARLVMARISSARQTQFCHNLKLLTDFLPNAVGRKLTARKGGALPSWLSWFIVLLAGFIIRQTLIVIVTS